MTIGMLLKKIEEGKKSGVLTDKSEVMLGLPSDFYKDRRQTKTYKLEAGSVTSLPLQYVCICDGFDPEDEIPNHLELGPSTKTAFDFYRHNNILDCEIFSE